MSNALYLKTDPDQFQAIWEDKCFSTVRGEDHNVIVGDTIKFVENKHPSEKVNRKWFPRKLEFTGRVMTVRVTDTDGKFTENGQVLISFSVIKKEVYPKQNLDLLLQK